MLALNHIHKSFGGFHVLDDVSIHIPAGGLVGVAGTNGAGKSTMFAVACGQIAPDAGTVHFLGEDITQLPPRKRAMKGLGRTFQIPKEFGSLSVLENLLVASPRARGESLYSVYFHPKAIRLEEKRIRERAEEVLEFLNLAHVARKSAAGLSGGQKKLLELGRALLLQPSCILLDEPFAGVNPVLIEQLSERILQLNKEKNIAFMIIEHHLEALRTLSNDLYIMDQGKVIAHGDPSTVLDNPSVQEAYMGGIV